jgi:hypothetical protein
MNLIESQSQFIVSGIMQIVGAVRKRAAVYVNEAIQKSVSELENSLFLVS